MPAPSLSSATNVLRGLGMRVSSARRHVLEALYIAEGPVTAAAVAGGLGGRLPTADLGSVYRNLAALEEAGVVIALRPAEGPRTFCVRGREPAGLALCACCGGRVLCPDCG
jgi:Fe2+ or Zn2+ uptake regulation protein